MLLATARALSATAAGFVFAVRSSAVGAIYGEFIVRCQNGHNNTINGITVEHTCETLGCNLKCVVDGGAWVVCQDDKNHRTDWCERIGRIGFSNAMPQVCRSHLRGFPDGGDVT
jgi:hypothetical protein